MAKDYFQDIKLTPEDDGRPQKPRPPARRTPPPPKPVQQEPIRINVRNSEPGADTEEEVEVQPARGIRNVSIPTRPRTRIDAGEPRGSFGGGPILPPRRPSSAGMGGKSGSRKWLWIIVVLCVVVLGGFSLFAFRPTTVTVTPRAHVVTFDSTSQFTAYPAESAATGTLPYTLVTQDLTDTKTVPSSGSQEVQQKAAGTITVYNNYSTAPQKLIANTRFQTPAGLIFRTPTAVTIPGKSGSTPGQINVSVVADQTGPSYNIGPTPRFTIPGLQSSSAQYQNIYGVSNAAMTGGFSGEKPSVSTSDEASAVAAMQSDLAAKVTQLVQENNDATTTALAGLAQVTYQEAPESTASDGSAQINENAHVVLPIFPASLFANTIAQTVSADVGDSAITLVPGAGFAATSDDASSTTPGVDPIDFSLAGTAQLIWQIDTLSLAQALAGKNQGAFTTVVNGFPGIEEASARIEPFWKNTFPENPADIKIVVGAPQAST